MSVPDVPWCRRCKLVECVCRPMDPCTCLRTCGDTPPSTGGTCKGLPRKLVEANEGMRRAGYRPISAIDRYMNSRD